MKKEENGVPIRRQPPLYRGEGTAESAIKNHPATDEPLVGFTTRRPSTKPELEVRYGDRRS